MMIGRVRGILIEKNPPVLLVDVQGLGLQLEATQNTFVRLPEPGVEVTLHTHFVVREDAMLLYGFAESDERALFRALIRVNGVGPRLALTLLSGISTSDFVRTIQAQDTTPLIRVPGIGKKTAERLVVEMQDRLADWQPALDLTAAGVPAAPAKEMGDAAGDALAALLALGYKPTQAEKALAAVRQPDCSREQLIRAALKQMMS
jgi:Holliday junction DNA helicase RuvA